MEREDIGKEKDVGFSSLPIWWLPKNWFALFMHVDVFVRILTESPYY
jgi:hypothetical protein